MKKLKHLQLLTALLLLFVLSSCKRENMCDCIKRTGTIETETRQLSGFTKLYVQDNLNVFITQDSVFEVKIEAGKNILPLIETEITDGTLNIKNKNRCNWTRSFKEPFNVYIKMPVIKYITSNGTGNIYGLNTFTTNSFDLEADNSGDIEVTVNNSKVTSHVFGAGDITIHGITYEHDCSIGGTSFLYCKDLQTHYTWLHTFTTGLCYINAKDSIYCRIDQVGDVYCYDHPRKVVKALSGDGQLYLQ